MSVEYCSKGQEVEMLRDDELVADVLCRFGAEAPDAPVWVDTTKPKKPDGSWCGRCAYGRLHEELTPITVTGLTNTPFGRATLALTGSYMPGQSGPGVRFNPWWVRGAWCQITIGELRAEMVRQGGVLHQRHEREAVKDWDAAQLVEEMVEA